MTESRADGAYSLRVGDAERDEAARELGEHYAVGRLTTDEFDDRIGRVYDARTGADLDVLFGDLPRPVASALPARRRRRLPVRMLAAAALLGIGLGAGVGVGHALGDPDGPPAPWGHVWHAPGGPGHGPWVYPGGPHP